MASKIDFKWAELGSDTKQKLNDALKKQKEITELEKNHHFRNKKIFAVLLAMCLLIQMQPFSFVFAESGSDAQNTETVAAEPEKKAEPAPAPEPKEEPKAEPTPAPQASEPEDSSESEQPEPSVPEEASEQEQGGSSSDDSVNSDNQSTVSDTEADKENADEEEAKDEEKEKYPAQTLSANAGGVKVTLKAPKGALPEGSRLKAHQVGNQYIEAVENTLEAQGRTLSDAVAIDVTPVNKDGKEIQPKKSVSVTFSGTGLDLEAGDTVDVFRVSDDASSVTEMNGSGNANSQTFKTSHFTIYVTGGSATNQNADPSGRSTNSQTNPYNLKYGASTLLIDDDSSSGSNTWRIADGGNYASLSAGTDFATRTNVTNTNTGTTDQIVHITHGNNANRHYYIKALAQRFTVSYKFQDVGQSTFADDGSEEVITGGSASQQPTHADKTQGGVTYTFDGWYTNSSCTTKATLTNITSDMEVYGRYKANKFTVIYDPGNHGTWSADDETYGNLEPNSKTPDFGGNTDTDHDAGWTFAGWNPAVDEKVTKSVTYVAQWEQDKYTVVYDPGTQGTWNASDETTTDLIYNADTPVFGGDTGSDHNPGWTFTGWNPTVDDKVTKSVTYVAQWEQDKYTVVYDPGTQGTWDADDETTTDLIYNADTPDFGGNTDTDHNPGYHFTDWDPAVDGKVTKSVTYTAQWAPDNDTPYTVEFYYMDKTTGDYPSTADDSDDRTGTTDTTASVSNADKEPAEAGYELDDSKDTDWSGNIKGDGSLVLKVYFKLTKYTVKYEPGTQGTWTAAAETYEDLIYGEDTPAFGTESGAKTTDCNPGYTFTGWEPSVDSTVKDDATYVAQWTAIEYNITYNYAGGTEPATPNPDKYTVETETVSISNEDSKEPTRDGYIFTGWTSFDTHPKILEPEKPVEWAAGAEVGDKTFVANWKKKVTLTYHKNSGDDQATITPPEEVIELGVGDKITLATAAYEGHHFEEWNTKDDGSGESVGGGGDEYTMPDHDVDLYAIWTEHPIQVIYNYNYPGAAEPWKSVSAPENDPYYQVTSDKPERDEYLFVGWSKDPDADEISEVEYMPGSYLPTEEEDITLYAVWVMEEHEQRSYTQTLEGFDKTVYYTGSEQELDWKDVEDDQGRTATIFVSSTDNPETHGDYKYAGFVRVGDKTDGGDEYHHLYADVEVTGQTVVKGTDAGIYNGTMAAPLYAHRQSTGIEGMVRLHTTDSQGNTGPEFVEVTKNRLTIKPIPIVITTDSGRKSHDGTPLTAGGTVTVGADDDDQNFPQGPESYNIEPGKRVEISLVNGENVIVEITGSRTDVGSSKNDVVVHWADSTGNQKNYTVTKSLGTLTVYDFTAEFDKNTGDDVHGVPEDWEGDDQPPGSRQHTLPSNVPTRAHSNFLGWATSADGDPEYGPDSIPGLSQTYTYPDGETAVKFYAKWSKEVDVVTYDPNGGIFNNTTRPTEVPYEYGDSITIGKVGEELKNVSKEHYEFKEWNTKKDGTGESYRHGQGGYEVKGEVTFYAQWTPIVYTIDYDYKGGASPSEPNPSTYTWETETVTIVKRPTKADYEFIGWTGSGITTPTPEISWSAREESGNKTYTANWKPVEYTITYDYDGADEPYPDNPTKYTVEDEEVAIENKPEKTGYTFTGWTGSGITTPTPEIRWSAGEETGDKEYKANWEPKDMKITYDANGGKIKGEDSITETHKYDESIKITEAATSEDGLIFKGWEEVDGDTYQPGDDYKVTKTTKFIAQWKMPITFDPTGGKLNGKTTPTVVEYDPGAEVTIADAPERKGYNFVEWNTSKDGKGDSLQPGDTREYSEATTFYAIWEPVKVSIIYDPNGGEFRGTTDSTEIEYDYNEVINIAEAPTREGYTFLYWKGSKYMPGDEYKVTEEHTFVAQWEKNEEPIPVDNKPNSGGTTKRTGIVTGDDFQLEYFIIMIFALIMMAAILTRREREMALASNEAPHKNGMMFVNDMAPAKRVLPQVNLSEPIKVSDSCTFRWTF